MKYLNFYPLIKGYLKGLQRCLAQRTTIKCNRSQQFHKSVYVFVSFWFVSKSLYSIWTASTLTAKSCFLMAHSHTDTQYKSTHFLPNSLIIPVCVTVLACWARNWNNITPSQYHQKKETPAASFSHVHGCSPSLQVVFHSTCDIYHHQKSVIAFTGSIADGAFVGEINCGAVWH